MDLISYAMRRRTLLKGSLALSATMMAPRLAMGQQTTTIVGVLETDPPQINCAITTSVPSYVTSCPVYQGLTYITADGTPTPQLATNWDISEDGLTYTFYLRDDVRWHDGEPFTSADVKFSIENANSQLHQMGITAYAPLQEIETPDDHTVVYRLSSPSASLMFATDRSVGAILPRHLWEGKDLMSDPLNHAPIGTGPYRFVSYQRGQEVRYAKNEDYYIEGKPYVDEVIIRIIPAAAARVAAFERGEADMIYFNALPQSEVPRLSSLPDVQTTRSPNRGAAFSVIFNMRNEYLAEKTVRKALAHAIDRRFIRENVDGGVTSVEQLGPVSPSSALYNTNLPDYAFDPELANQLLDEAGFPRQGNGTRFELEVAWASANTAAGNIADIIQQNLAQVGIAVTLFSADQPALQDRAYRSGNFDMTIENLVIGPDPDIGMERLYNSAMIAPVPNRNNSNYINPEVDALFDEQRSLIDLEERKAVYDRIQEIIWDDLPTLTLYQLVRFNLNRSSYVVDVYEDDGNGAHESYENAKIVGVHV